jgi:dipeptidyl aminopeptidase/acylaminoacyl peptidase
MRDTTASPAAAAIAPYMDIEAVIRPVFSFDGKCFVYLSDGTGTHQVWMRRADGEEARQLTRMDEPVGSVAFSPCSHDLIFTTDCGGDERHQLWLLRDGETEPVALTHDAATVHAWGCWSPDGSRIAYSANARDKSSMDVFVLDLATRAATCVRRGDGYRDPLAFFADNRALLLREWADGPHGHTLQRLDLDTGTLENLLPHRGKAEYRAVRMRRDGSGFHVLSDQDSDHFRIGFAAADGSELQWLIDAPSRSIDAMAIHPGQDSIAYAINDEGWSRIEVRDMAAGTSRRIEGLPPGIAGSLAWIPGSRTLVFPYEGARTAPSLYMAHANDCIARPLVAAHTGALQPAAFIEPELAHVRSFDGLQIPCFIYSPAGDPPAGGYPVVVIVHGGPAMAWTSNFRGDVQYLAARGIMVVAPNVRGSSGYGRRYHELDDRERRMDSVEDLHQVRLWLEHHPHVDARRIAVFGRSYGGFMVLAALTAHPESWKLGIDFYGIANFHTLLQTTGPWRRDLRAAEYGWPAADADLLTRISPIHRMHRLNAPLMIVQGLDDPRVTPGESEMLYSVTRGLGKTVQYLRIPHEGHGFTRRSNRHIVFGALAQFIDTYL